MTAAPSSARGSAEAHWGTGANAESKALIAHLAFNVLGIERLAAYADLENPRSQAALTRLGFKREGCFGAGTATATRSTT